MFPATTRDRSMTRKPWSIPWKSGLKDFCCIGTSSTSLCPTQWGHVSITALLGSALHYHGWTIGATGAGARDEVARMYCCSWQYGLLQPLTCPYSTNILEEVPSDAARQSARNRVMVKSVFHRETQPGEKDD